MWPIAACRFAPIKVRVAHALKTLPRVSEHFAAGELSYSKVRALTPVATRDNEKVLIEFALRHTAAHVAERCRELQFGTMPAGA